MDAFEDYLIVLKYAIPGVAVKGWVNKFNYYNTFREDWNELIPIMDKLYQEHMSDKLLKAMMTFDIEECYKVTVEVIKEYNQKT